jgi:hypothetical protein
VDYDELEKLKRTGLFRWNIGISIYQSGLPFQDACLLNTLDSDEKLYIDIAEFIHRWQSAKTAKMMIIRPDAIEPRKVPPVYHGPLHDNIDEVLERVKEFTSMGFVVSLWGLDEYRVKRRGSNTIMFESSEKITIEMLGGGYDNADMAKGMIRPQIIVSMKQFAPPLLALRNNMEFLPFYLDISELQDEQSQKERIARRLEFLARCNKISIAEQIENLKRNGDTRLFDDKKILDWQELKTLFRFAIHYAEFKQLHGLPFRYDALAIDSNAKGIYSCNNAWNMDKYK